MSACWPFTGAGDSMNAPYRTLIVIPCYNEARRLDRTAVESFLNDAPDVGLCFVDDGSSDATLDVLTGLARAHDAVEVHQLVRNSGKAEAVRQGMLRVLERRPEFVGYWDADLATPLAAIHDFVVICERDERLRMIMGARVALLGHTIRRSAARHYVGRIIATAAAATLGLPVYDTQCGAKLLRAATARSLFEPAFHTRWMFDVELIARIIAQEGSRAGAGTYLREVPLKEWRHVHDSKLRMRDGVLALRELYRIYRQYPKLG